MATITLGQVVTNNIPVIQSYTQRNPIEGTPLLDSGVAFNFQQAQEIADGESVRYTLPYWNAISNDPEPYYPNDNYNDIAEPRLTGSGALNGRMALLAEGFRQASLVRELSSQDPLEAIGNYINTYWRYQVERRAWATLLGVYNANVANDKGDMRVTADTFGASAYIDAEQTRGDQVVTSGGLLIVHSKVRGDMRKANLIDTITPADGTAPFEVYGERRIIVSDSLVTVGTGNNRKFISILADGGLLGYGMAPFSQYAEEADRDPARATAGGVDTLWTRRKLVLHPQGFNFTENVLTGTPNQTGVISANWKDLTDKTNWERTVDRKEVPVSFLVTG